MVEARKVAFVASVYRHLEGFHLPFMRWLQEKGYQVHAYGFPDKGKQYLEEADIICHDIPFQRNPYQFSNLFALRKLISSFKKEGFKMVHVHTPVASILGRIAAKLAKVPSVIYTAHGFHFFKGAPLKFWLLYYPIERFMAYWTDYLVTINQEDFERAKGFSVRKEVFYVPGVGLDINKYGGSNNMTEEENLRKAFSLKKEDFVIVCVAELKKNQIQLIRAVENLLSAGKKVKCFFVGSGKDEVKLRQYIEAKSLIDNIYILGYRTDVPELMAMADVVALLSEREGLPRVIMEAMAVGKPLIATDIRGNRDLIIDGDNGYLVPVHDVDATVQAIENFLINSELKLEMGKTNQELVQQYDIRRITELMGSIYNRALNEVTGGLNYGER